MRLKCVSIGHYQRYEHFTVNFPASFRSERWRGRLNDWNYKGWGNDETEVDSVSKTTLGAGNLAFVDLAAWLIYSTY